MQATVIYESMYGNTRKVAQAIAEGLGGARAVPVHQAGPPEEGELLVVGGPTHVHGLSSGMSRKGAVDAAQEDGHPVEPGATADYGLREWLRDLEHVDYEPVATFDTRIDRSALLTGTAARGIARRMHRRGYEILATESFFVEDSEGPLAEGELDRARAWGESLAARVEELTHA
jgi:flavodoxin